MLYLNGERGNGLINNVCFPSNIAQSYAPAGQVKLSRHGSVRVKHAAGEASEHTNSSRSVSTS